MSDIEKYRKEVKEIIRQYAKERPLPENVEAQLIFDTEEDHYQLVHVGWNRDQWIHGCVLHMDIKNEKVWIQYNGTEIDIAEELIKRGIPEKNIVIGFHSPYKRQFTQYAVG